MPSSHHPALILAAAASVAAGLVHAAAAGSHAGLATLSLLFAVTALAQIAWGAAALVRPTAPVVAAGIGIHVVAVGAWVTSRTVGVSAVEGLEGGQTVALQDGLAAGLEAVAVLGAGLALTSVTVPRIARSAVPALVVALALATVPAMAQPHDHGSHDHDGAAVTTGGVAGGATHAHDDDHDHADTDHATDHHGADDHVAGEPHDGGAGDAAAGPTADADLGYPAGFAAFLDRAPDAAARERAERLLVETNEAMRAFPDEAAIQAAGFVSIGDGATGWEHYIHVERIADPRVLDPDDIESIVLRVHPDGTKEVASAMYLLPFGATMADVPDIAGDLTAWHDHQNLCWEGVRVVGTTDASGSCARGEFRPTQPMLHVWVTEHPCGPFAGIEGSHGSGCDHHDH